MFQRKAIRIYEGFPKEIIFNKPKRKFKKKSWQNLEEVYVELCCFFYKLCNSGKFQCICRFI